MTKRLIKIAKELNVGTATIVEHLNNSGFDIENKPTSPVNDEMYAELLKEFQKSIVIKQQADQLIIGTRPTAKYSGESTTTLIKKPEVLTSSQHTLQEEMIIEKAVPAKEKKKEEIIERPKVKTTLKVVGKIDLKTKPKTKKEDKPKSAPTKKEEAKVTEVEKIQEEATVEKIDIKGKKETEKPPALKEEKKLPEKTESSEIEEKKKEKGVVGPEELIRAETPELRGLKILGKIDADKLKRPKKKKKEKPKAAVASDAGKKKDKPVAAADKNKKQELEQARKKRKRKRRVIPTTENRNAPRDNIRKRGGGRRREEVKEVSQKEIDEKIKATMARLTGSGKKKRQKLRRESRERQRERQEIREQEMHTDKLQLTEFVSVSELAGLMDVPVADVITTCMNLGVIVSINQRLDAEIIEVIAEEFGHEVDFINAEEQIEEEEEIIDDPEDLIARAPIVTVMGHVDHGKTSLLDYVRSTNVVAGEAGGITQHIGAYEVEIGEGKNKITFLDTPGHEAFTAMRARGAKVTDIAVIIIAGDDKIMPQTKEAISHAQAAGVPIVFAINKIDVDGAAPERIKQELASMNLLIEEWGGKYQSQDISAKTGENVDLLLEKILLEAEILELKANPDRQAIGSVIEASLDKGRGYVTKMLVQTGTLNIGDSMVAGECSGKVKAMFNERGKRVKTAGPSTPVLVLGLNGAPQAGERFKILDTEQETRSIASRRAQISREQANRAAKRISLDEIGRRLALGSFKELNLIVKGDVDGSIEALSDSLIKQSIETVQVNVIHKAVGQIIESDILLASASDAVVIGFQVRPSLGARKLAEREGVQIKLYSVIYEAIEEVRSAIEGMLEPTKEEKIVGQVEVKEVYKISKVGTVAGCQVQEGKISRNDLIRLVRNGIVIYPTREGVVGEIASLKRFKEDVKEVKTGVECGISIKNFNDIKVGDVIEAYEIITIKQTLD